MDIVSVVGRKKEAVARVRLSPGDGQIIVNAKPIHEYFSTKVAQRLYLRPLELTQTQGEYAVSIKVAGGGQTAQLGATVFALAKALSKTNSDFRVILKRAGYLTRDARVKERRKYGNAHKARAKKQSPKR